MQRLIFSKAIIADHPLLRKSFSEGTCLGYQLHLEYWTRVFKRSCP